MLRSVACASSGADDVADAVGAAATATRWRTSSSPPGSGREPASAALGGELWGCTTAASCASLCYAGANLVPVEADARGDRRVRRPGPPAGPALLLDRRTRRRRAPRCGRCSNRPGDRPATSAPDQPLMAIDAAAARRAGPRGPAGHAWTSWTSSSRPASRCTPRRSASRRRRRTAARLYRARVAELIAAGPVVRPDRGRPRWCSRPRSARSPRRPARSRASGSTPTHRGEGWPRRAWRPSSQHRARRGSRRSVIAVRQRLQPPARPTYARVGFADVGTFATVLLLSPASGPSVRRGGRRRRSGARRQRCGA